MFDKRTYDLCTRNENEFVSVGAYGYEQSFTSTLDTAIVNAQTLAIIKPNLGVLWLLEIAGDGTPKVIGHTVQKGEGYAEFNLV